MAAELSVSNFKNGSENTMKIKITADSTCDLSQELIKKYDIEIVPLGVLKGGKYFSDGIDIVPDDIFSHVANGGDLCSTAAVNVEDYTQIFRKYSAENDAVIHINIGSGFSSCYQNACIAAKEFDNVYVVDSQNLSTGQGHIVLEAAERAAVSDDPAALADDMRKLAERVEASFILNRLDYMVKGGRCSMVAALGANLLKLKPCIEVAGGAMRVAKKYRGSYSKCLNDYIRERLSGRDDIIRDKVFITYTPVEPSDLEVARKAVEEYGHFARVMETTAGCTVSCHCGPATLGVLFIRKA